MLVARCLESLVSCICILVLVPIASLVSSLSLCPEEVVTIIAEKFVWNVGGCCLME